MTRYGYILLFELYFLVSTYGFVLRNGYSTVVNNGVISGSKRAFISMAKIPVNRESSPSTKSSREQDKLSAEKPKKPLLSVRELFTPPSADGYSIALTLAGQGLLVNLAFMVSVVYSFFDKRQIGADFMSFDSESMKLALAFAAPMIVGGFILDKLPMKPFPEIARDTRIFVLRLLGLRTTFLSTILIAFIVSGTELAIIE